MELDGERPAVITVFGVLNIVFGGLGVLGTIVALVGLIVVGVGSGLPDGLLESQSVLVAVLGFAGEVVLLASGVGLLMMRPWGRRLSIVYGICMVAVTAVHAALAIGKVQSATSMWLPYIYGGIATGVATVGMILGFGFGLAYPLLLLIVMTRKGVAEAFTLTPTPLSDLLPPPA